MARTRHKTSLPAPYLKRLMIDAARVKDRDSYPMNLSWLDPETFELSFEQPVTIIVGENGTGKSTLIEAIAGLAGYDEAGGGKGYRAVDHSDAVDRSGTLLSEALRAAWLPKVTAGWFFRAETFFSVARYLDTAARDARKAPPDFLSWSHGEGFVRFFEERMSGQGLYFMDEPESALSPNRQLELVRLLSRIQAEASAQVIMATHSPILMAVPGAQVLEINGKGLTEIDYRETQHFQLYRAFTTDPQAVIDTALSEAS